MSIRVASAMLIVSRVLNVMFIWYYLFGFTPAHREDADSKPRSLHLIQTVQGINQVKVWAKTIMGGCILGRYFKSIV